MISKPYYYGMQAGGKAPVNEELMEEIRRRNNPDPGVPSPEKQREMMRKMREEEIDRKMQEAVKRVKDKGYAGGGMVKGYRMGGVMPQTGGVTPMPNQSMVIPPQMKGGSMPSPGKGGGPAPLGPPPKPFGPPPAVPNMPNFGNGFGPNVYQGGPIMSSQPAPQQPSMVAPSQPPARPNAGGIAELRDLFLGRSNRY